jgi:hypothetical protein
MTITLTLVGESIADIFRQVGVDKNNLSTTEELIEELRRRMRPQGLVVNIDPVQEPTGDETTSTVAELGDVAIEIEDGAQATWPDKPAADKPKRGRPRKPEIVATPATEPVKGANGPATAVTRDEVIAALNSYSAARGGQVAARQVMQETCGVARLVDVKIEDYPKLLARLTA